MKTLYKLKRLKYKVTMCKCREKTLKWSKHGVTMYIEVTLKWLKYGVTMYKNWEVTLKR